MTTDSPTQPEILFETQGAIGLITLNRPKALNALTLGMVTAMRAQLKTWETDPAVGCVVIRGAGDRAFCAGADIRALRQSGLDGTSYALDFLREEYLLNAAIKHYPKPYIALIRGICMGGGMGLSVHGDYRIASSSAVFAMPETAIGFFPDVGGSYFLSRCPGQLGLYFGLTGERLNTRDAIYARLATHWIPSEEWPVLIEALAGGDDPTDLFSEMGRRPQNSPLSERRTKIDRIFGTTSVEDVLTLLDRDDKEWSHETAALMRSRSPTSLKIAYGQIRNGSQLSFDECMKMEFRIAHRITTSHDFIEGVRAVIVDKDNAPKWQPASLAEIADADVQSYFEPIADELPL
jgi:Enoyl-CoA hydratase/carnithine racemase